MWLVACFSPLCTCVFPPALTISCSIFFAAFNGLISTFTRAYYLADTWNSSNILIERFTRVLNFGVAKMGRNEVKILSFNRSLHIHPFVETASLCEKGKYWFVFDLPRSSFQCFISWRTFKVYLQFKKETSWKIDYRLINNSEQRQSLQKTVRYFKHRQTIDIALKMIQKCKTSIMPNFSAKKVF